MGKVDSSVARQFPLARGIVLCEDVALAAVEERTIVHSNVCPRSFAHLFGSVENDSHMQSGLPSHMISAAVQK